MKGVFVTGTDTGCGKTRVGMALAAAAREAGFRVRVLKPVETGCAPGPSDAEALAHAAEDPRPLERICPYRLPLPAAPLVAARRAGVTLELGRIEAALRDAEAGADLVLAEGAGGLRVPVTEALDMAGLAAVLGLPLLVVARAALGTVNHTLLTLEAAAASGLRVCGVAFSHVERPAPESDRANLGALLERLRVPCLGELPHGGERLEPALDMRRWVASLPGA